MNHDAECVSSVKVPPPATDAAAAYESFLFILSEHSRVRLQMRPRTADPYLLPGEERRSQREAMTSGGPSFPRIALIQVCS